MRSDTADTKSREWDDGKKTKSVCGEESWIRKCRNDVYHIYCSRAAASDTRRVLLSQIKEKKWKVKLQQGLSSVFQPLRDS